MGIIVQIIIQIICLLSVLGSASEGMSGLAAFAVFNWIFNGIAYSQMRARTNLAAPDELQPPGNYFWTVAHILSSLAALIILIVAIASTGS